MKLLQSPNNSDDSTDHLCVHTMTEPKKLGLTREGGTKNQCAVLYAAETAQIGAVAPLQNISRLCPDRRGQRRPGSFLFSIDDEE